MVLLALVVFHQQTVKPGSPSLITISIRSQFQINAKIDQLLRSNVNSSVGGSLLQFMSHAVILFGLRLLTRWITHPLCDKSMIHARFNAVSETLESKPQIHHIISHVLITLAKAIDVQHGITRIFHGTAIASEFISVIQAILIAGKQLQKPHITVEDEDKFLDVKTVLSVLLRKLILAASSSSFTNTTRRLNKEAADQRDLLNLPSVAGGKFPEVAAARTNLDLANEKMDQLIGLYRKQLRMRNLKLIRVSGVAHLIEVPLDVIVPSNWVKVNNTKKTICYIPPEAVSIPRTNEDECLIRISDDLWDIMSNEEVCDIARKRIMIWHKINGVTLPLEGGEGIVLAPQAAAQEYLSNQAITKGSKDNVTGLNNCTELMKKNLQGRLHDAESRKRDKL